MWEWRVWVPLSAENPADITALLGYDIEVEQTEELHFDVDPSVDLRRVYTWRQKHAHEWSEAATSKGESSMQLRHWFEQ